MVCGVRLSIHNIYWMKLYYFLKLLACVMRSSWTSGVYTWANTPDESTIAFYRTQISWGMIRFIVSKHCTWTKRILTNTRCSMKFRWGGFHSIRVLEHIMHIECIYVGALDKHNKCIGRLLSNVCCPGLTFQIGFPKVCSLWITNTFTVSCSSCNINIYIEWVETWAWEYECVGWWKKNS